MVAMPFLMRVRECCSSITVEPIIFGYIFAGVIAGPVVQDLTYRRICAGFFNQTVCAHLNDPGFKEQLDVVQAKNSYFSAWLTAAFCVPLILMGNLFGTWSDRYGRK